MKNEPLLLFDLDDTIFETKSIGRVHVASVLDSFKQSIASTFEAKEVEAIVSDLWKYPFDHVVRSYNLSDAVKKQFSTSVNNQDYQFDISPFEDFELIKDIEVKKVLVTTGFRKLQLAKIEALQLEEVFEEVHIDAIDEPHRVYKKGIFERLIKSWPIQLQDFIVIGDNPESELKAGHELGLRTVQIAKLGQTQSAYADHFISDFEELLQLLKEKYGHLNQPNL